MTEIVMINVNYVAKYDDSNDKKYENVDDYYCENKKIDDDSWDNCNYIDLFVRLDKTKLYVLQ